MLVITQNTEQRLYVDLKQCVRHTPTRKCFFLEFSQSGIPRAALLESFLRILDEVPNSYMAQVYICADMDIFIIMQGFMQRHFIDFVKQLGQDLGQDNLLKYTKIFEAGLHWRELEMLCMAKLDRIQNEILDARSKLRKQDKIRIADGILEGLDTALINTIVERRNNSSRLQIQIVDDDKLTRALVGNILAQPLQSAFSHNGKEALSDYISLAPDVLFLDIGLPDINGHRVLESLMQIDPSAYIIMLSGLRDKGNILRALDNGAQGFIGKPFTRSKLFEYIYKSPSIRIKQERKEAETFLLQS